MTNNNVTLEQVKDVLRHAHEKGYRQLRHALADPDNPKHTCALGVILQELYGWDGVVKGKLVDNGCGYRTMEWGMFYNPWRKHNYLKDFEDDFGWKFSLYIHQLNDNDKVADDNYSSCTTDDKGGKWTGRLTYSQIADMLDRLT